MDSWEKLEHGLKPCPFCGGTAAVHEMCGDAWVLCGTCGAETAMHSRWEEAAADWNRRAERTCRMELVDMYNGGEGYTYAECTGCRAQFTMPDDWRDTDNEILPHEFSYCPNCGARVEWSEA